MNIMFILLSLLIITIVISVHEFGHFIVAKKLGFKIKEYSIGFGKKLLSKTDKNEITYSLRLLPLGGYVNIPEEEFKEKSGFKQLLVSISGVIFNFIFALIICILLQILKGNSFIDGIYMFIELNKLMFTALLDIFKGHTEEVGGVISLISVSSTIISKGIYNIMLLIIVININVAFFNLLPIPSLDGGRIISSILKIIFKKTSFKYENNINFIGFLLLMGLALLLIGKDIFEIFIK